MNLYQEWLLNQENKQLTNKLAYEIVDKDIKEKFEFIVSSLRGGENTQGEVT